MSFPTTQNFGVSIPKNIQAAGNTYGPQAFGSGFNASKIPGLAFNSNVKVSSGLPSISKPQDYNSKGTKVSTKDVVKSINKASDKQVAKSVGGMITRDGSVLTYDIATGIGISSVSDVRKGLKDNAGSIKNDINKGFKTDKMTKNVGNVADVKNSSTFPGGRVGTGGGREMPVANPEFGGNGAKVRQAFDARANARAIADKAPVSNRLMAPTPQVAPATKPTAVAIAKSAPAAAPKPAPAPPVKAAAKAPSAAPSKPTAAAVAKAVSPNAPAPKAAAPAPKAAPPPPAKPSGGGNKGGGGKKK